LLCIYPQMPSNKNVLTAPSRTGRVTRQDSAQALSPEAMVIEGRVRQPLPHLPAIRFLSSRSRLLSRRAAEPRVSQPATCSPRCLKAPTSARAEEPQVQAPLGSFVLARSQLRTGEVICVLSPAEI
jgi:hypothetical protein